MPKPSLSYPNLNRVYNTNTIYKQLLAILPIASTENYWPLSYLLNLPLQEVAGSILNRINQL